MIAMPLHTRTWQVVLLALACRWRISTGSRMRHSDLMQMHSTSERARGDPTHTKPTPPTVSVAASMTQSAFQPPERPLAAPLATTVVSGLLSATPASSTQDISPADVVLHSREPVGNSGNTGNTSRARFEERMSPRVEESSTPSASRGASSGSFGETPPNETIAKDPAAIVVRAGVGMRWPAALLEAAASMRRHAAHAVGRRLPSTLATGDGLPVESLDGVAKLLTQLLMVFVFGCRVYQAVTGDNGAIELHEAVRDKRNKLNETIQELVIDMETSLHAMSESSALLAEKNFEDKRKDFKHFLRTMASAQSKLDDPRLVAPFTRFCQQWVAVFEECSIDPLAEPLRVVSKEELARCTTALDVAELTLARLEKCHAKAVSKSLSKLSRLRPGSADATEQDTSSMKPMTNPLGRFLSIACPMLGVSLGLVHAVCGDITYAVAAFVASAISPFIMSRFVDESSFLDVEIEELQEKFESVKLQHQQVHDFYGELARVSSLWLHRTVPQLEIMKEVHEAFEDLTQLHDQQVVVRFLQTAIDQVDQVTLALGPLKIWCGPAALSEDMLQVVSSQLSDPSGGVSTRSVENSPSRMSKMRKTAFGAQKDLDLVGKHLHEKLDDWEVSSACRACKQSFITTLRPRHNCRRCGGAFCKSCSSNKVPVPNLGYNEPVRVCDSCAVELRREMREKRKEKQEGIALPIALRKVARLGFLHVRVLRATSLPNVDSHVLGDLSDPYVRLRVSEKEWFRTDTIFNNLNPIWEDDFFFSVNTNDKLLLLQVLDYNKKSADVLLGSADIKFKGFPANQWHSLNIPLGVSGGTVSLELRFLEDSWHLA